MDCPLLTDWRGNHAPVDVVERMARDHQFRPVDIAAKMRAEIAKWGKLIKTAGIVADP